MTAAVGVFRLQLFKPSEGFITSQAERLRRYRPVYIGRRLFGPAPEGARVATPPGEGAGQWLTALEVAVRKRARPFVEALRDDRPSIIHAHFAIDSVFAAPLAAQLHAPLLTTLHGFDVTRTPWDMLRSGRPSLVNGVLGRKGLMRQGKLFLCVSEFIRQAALRRDFPADKLRVHYIGIDCGRLSARTDAGDDDLVVHVGRLVEKKGTAYLIQAFVEVRRRFPSARLAIVGDGPLREELQSQARALGLAEAVQFHGVRRNDEVLSLVRQAAVMVVPSVTGSDGDSEGFGIVNIEAGAQGVPVVGYRSGGIVEAIEDGYSGLLCEERDVDGLVRHICTLLESRHLREKVGRQARRYVEDRFDLSKQTAKLEQIYDELSG